MNRIVIVSLAAVIAHFTLACTAESENEKSNQQEVTSSEVDVSADQVQGNVDPTLTALNVKDEAALTQDQLIDPANIIAPSLNQKIIVKPSAPQRNLAAAIDPKK